MNKYSGFILKIVKQIEEKFDCIAYGYIEDNHNWWNVCVSDYNIYVNEDFKRFCKNWHIISRKRGFKILFSFCTPIESKLNQLSNNYNLVMNV